MDLAWDQAPQWAKEGKTKSDERKERSGSLGREKGAFARRFFSPTSIFFPFPLM